MTPVPGSAADGADVRALGMADLRALYWELADAAKSDHDRAHVLLAQHPEVLEHHEYGGETPLHYLAVENHVSAVRFLLSMGASANPTNRFGQSPLQETVFIHKPRSSYLDIIRLLLEAGADPHHKSETIDSAWEQVQGSEELELVRLVRRFANP
ncbi:MAG: ankyrin repeat domain-containing protein [Phycisphaerales bacterium]